MTKVTLTLRKELRPPTDLSRLVPEELAGKSISQMGNIPLSRGNRTVKVRDLFKIVENKGSEENEVVFVGDLRTSRRIGFQMKRGTIRVNGNAGLYVGEGLDGGTIVVDGNADSWAGTRMRNGLIEVKGNAGHFVGSSYRGSREGMKGGRILIQGDVGDEAGSWMNGGLIHVKGSADQFTGIHMKGGTILVEQDCGDRTGAEMIEGTMVALGKIGEVLPSFTIYDVRSSVKIGQEKMEGPFYVFEGDVNEEGHGRIYAHKERNDHLKGYERFLGGFE